MTFIKDNAGITTESSTNYESKTTGTVPEATSAPGKYMPTLLYF